MNNKKIEYINLLLPTILYFVLFMLEVVIGHGITKALFTVYFIVFIILGVMLNSRFKNKVKQENDDKPFDLSQIKEDKYHDIIRYYTESDEEHKARK